MMIMTNQNGWPSEQTRGYQVAQALGCKFNTPINDYNETVIAVKCYFSYEIQPDLARLKNMYLDLIDDVNIVIISRNFPTHKLIVLTDMMRDYLSSQIPNEIVVVPEHSCNFEQVVRQRDEVRTVGYVGSSQCFDLDINDVKNVLGQIGLDFKYLVCEGDSVTRKDVCEFYKSIDIQLTFRKPGEEVRPTVYRNPLKVFNAGSFKIPTVSFPELSYRICAGTYFLEAIDLGSVIDKCYMLKHDKGLYDFYANRSYEWSKQFDIAKIARLYAALAPTETFDIENNVKKMRGAA